MVGRLSEAANGTRFRVEGDPQITLPSQTRAFWQQQYSRLNLHRITLGQAAA